MSLPFEVPTALSVTYFRLWTLRQQCSRIYRYEALRKLVLSFISTHRFSELNAAIADAVGPFGAGVVHLTRNVTLPSVYESESNSVWALVYGKVHVILQSKGGPWRLRLRLSTSAKITSNNALLAVGPGARVSIRHMHFSLWSRSQTGLANAHLAILQPGVALSSVEIDDIRTQGFSSPLVAPRLDAAWTWPAL